MHLRLSDKEGMVADGCSTLVLPEAHLKPELRKSETRIYSRYTRDMQMMHIHRKHNNRTAKRKKSKLGGQKEHEDSPRQECC